MRKMILSTLLTLFGLTTGFAASEPKPSIGIVNFSTCVTESKLGKQEQSSFESLRNQMSSLIDDTSKKISEIDAKFNDKEYMDSISPEDEVEMRNTFRALNEEMNRYQSQYYQVLNQANMKVLQTIDASIKQAAEKVAKAKKLNYVLNKDALFFFTSTLDVTPAVIAEMDKEFNESKNIPAGSPAIPAPPAAASAGNAK